MDFEVLLGATVLVGLAVGGYYCGFEAKKVLSSTTLAALLLLGGAFFVYFMFYGNQPCDSNLQDCSVMPPLGHGDTALTRGLLALLAISVPGIAGALAGPGHSPSVSLTKWTRLPGLGHLPSSLSLDRLALALCSPFVVGLIIGLVRVLPTSTIPRTFSFVFEQTLFAAIVAGLAGVGLWLCVFVVILITILPILLLRLLAPALVARLNGGIDALLVLQRRDAILPFAYVAGLLALVYFLLASPVPAS